MVINWNNPLTRGLVLDIPLFEGGGTRPKATVGQEGDSSFNSTPTWRRTKFGNVMDFTPADGNQAVLFKTNANVNSLELFSLEIVFMTRGRSGVNDDRILQKGDASAYWFTLTPTTTANRVRFDKSYTGATDAWYASAADNQWHHFVMSVTAITTIGVAPTFYLDGVNVAAINDGVADGTKQPDSTNFTLGNRQSTYARGYDGEVAYYRMWNRILSASEAKQLYTDPWQIYAKPLSPLILNTLDVTPPAVTNIVSWKSLLGVGL